jgi:hypothetical protein
MHITDVQQSEKKLVTSGSANRANRATTALLPDFSGPAKPVGTFGGSMDFVLRIRNGKAVAADTGDQGGGQN